MKKFKFKNAFTLAEVLTTLAIIGVISAITFPITTSSVKTQVLDKSRLVFAQQFRDGLSKMRLAGLLSAEYSSTSDFANAMKKSFNIVKICDKNSLKNCFPSNFKADIKYTENDSIVHRFTTTNITTSTDLDNDIGFTSDVAGVVLNNGMQILLAYDTDCTGPAQFGKNTDIFTCIKYVADVNGSKGPNLLYQDIVTNVQLFDLEFQTFASENSLSWEAATSYCADNGGRLPGASDLSKIAALIYTNDACSDKNRTVANGQFEYGKDKPCNVSATYSSEAWKQFLGNKESVYYWTNDTSGENAYYRSFLKSGSSMQSINKNHNGIKAFCIR